MPVVRIITVVERRASGTPPGGILSVLKNLLLSAVSNPVACWSARVRASRETSTAPSRTK